MSKESQVTRVLFGGFLQIWSSGGI